LAIWGDGRGGGAWQDLVKALNIINGKDDTPTKLAADTVFAGRLKNDAFAHGENHTRQIASFFEGRPVGHAERVSESRCRMAGRGHVL